MIKSEESRGILTGLLGGLLWGLDTVLVGIILSTSSFKSFVMVAPLVSTFLHDLFSSLWLVLYTGVKKNFSLLKKSLVSKSGRYVMVAALFGGPIGMTGYVMSIKYIGSTYTAVISAMYPAVGSLLGYLFLKERLSKRGIFGLLLAVVATMLLGITSTESPKNLFLGFLFASMCVLGWGCECVICAYGMKNDVLPDIALQIRQLVSALFYAILIIPIIGGYGLVIEVVKSPLVILIIITAFAGTCSYLCYYRSINQIGAIKAMGLNISYSAWAIFIGVLFGNSLSFEVLILSFLIITGSILTTDNPREFFSLFYKIKGSR